MRVLIVAGVMAAEFVVQAASLREDPAKYWDFAELSLVPAVRPCETPASRYPYLQAWYVQGKGPKDTKAEFFCYYAVPDTPKPAGGYPGVVMVHGGGGTAYPQYVDAWRRRGLAVLALDWNNRQPAAGLTNVVPGDCSIPRIELAGGRRQDHVACVANIVLAHSLLLSRPEVNPKKTAMVGLSWGSWYGACAAAVDPRFNGAVEIYCGDFDTNKTWLVNGRFLHAAKVPMWWTVSPNDNNVSVTTSQAGYDECANFDGCANVINLPHSHVGFKFESVLRMVLHYADGQIRLPKLGAARVSDGVISAPVLFAGKGLGRAALCYTADADVLPEYKRSWTSVPATIRDGVVSARIPAEAYRCCLAVYEKDEGRWHELCGTTGFVTLPKPQVKPYAGTCPPPVPKPPRGTGDELEELYLLLNDAPTAVKTVPACLGAAAWGEDAPRLAKIWKTFAAAVAKGPGSARPKGRKPFQEDDRWPLQPMPASSSATEFDCFGKGDLDELCIRTQAMCGELEDTADLDALAEKHADDARRSQMLGVLKAFRILCRSERDILEFYRVRREAVLASRARHDNVDALRYHAEMFCQAANVKLDAEDLLALCEPDPRLGFDSAAGKYVFHAALLKWRIRDFVRVYDELIELEHVLALTADNYPTKK